MLGTAMTAQHLYDLAMAAPSLKKRVAMKHAESLKLDKLYTLLEKTASLGRTFATFSPFELGANGYEVIKFAEEEFDEQHFNILIANKIESAIPGLRTSIDGDTITLDWSAPC